MCLARGMYFSRKTAGLPNARPASPRASSSRLCEIRRFVHDAHAAAAAAKRRFDDQRKTNFLGDLQRFVAVVNRLFRSGQGGHTDLLRQRARRRLVAHHLEQFGTRTDEGDSRLGTGAGKLRVLGQETVTRMNHIHTLFLRQRDDALDVEVRADRPFAFADQVGFVRLETMDGKTIFLRVNRDGAQPEFGRRAKDANGVSPSDWPPSI